MDNLVRKSSFNEVICDCENDGVCELQADGTQRCNCPEWYLGNTCEIDGRLLLIGLAAMVGILLLIAIICCAICIYKIRQQQRDDDVTSVISLGRGEKLTSGSKMPRSWMDTWRYYSFTPAYPGPPGQCYPTSKAHFSSNPPYSASIYNSGTLGRYPSYPTLSPGGYPRRDFVASATVRKEPWRRASKDTWSKQDLVPRHQIIPEVHSHSVVIPRPQLTESGQTYYVRPDTWFWSPGNSHYTRSSYIEHI